VVRQGLLIRGGGVASVRGKTRPKNGGLCFYAYQINLNLGELSWHESLFEIGTASAHGWVCCNGRYILSGNEGGASSSSWSS